MGPGSKASPDCWNASPTKRIRAAAAQMTSLIEDLLNLARASRAEIHPQMTDLGAEVARIAEEHQHQEPGRHVRFTIQQPVWAWADLTLIRTVLQNLMDNAWKFTSGRDGATIEFGTTPDGTSGNAFTCGTTALASTPPTPASCSSHSSDCMQPPSSPVPAWAWRA
jgi:signal transduction histidine kinase